jgi:hypothetical protein
LRNKTFEEKETQKYKTKQNKTELLVVVVNHFVLGTTVVCDNQKQIHGIYCTKSFSLEKITQKLPDFEGKQKLKVVRF